MGGGVIRSTNLQVKVSLDLIFYRFNIIKSLQVGGPLDLKLLKVGGGPPHPFIFYIH